MKAGTKFTYPRVECFYCGKMIAENWIIRHRCNKKDRVNEILSGIKTLKEIKELGK